METKLDLNDIQGNIIKGYGRYGYPKSRYVFYKIKQGKKASAEARAFIQDVIQLITTSTPWSSEDSPVTGVSIQPDATTNVAFTYQGLKNVGVPRKSLQSFPQAFAMGMKARKDILGDDGVSAPEHWDPIWCNDTPVDMWLSINGRTEDAIETRYQAINALVEKHHEGIELLTGHRGDHGEDNLPYQQASAVHVNGKPTPQEHFGYVDGISDPYFEGSGTNPENVIGGGKLTGEDPTTKAGWAPLETGEFILGHRDEAFEYPKAPIPPLLSRNGTFMVYRKLHENVGSFNKFIEETGAQVDGGKEEVAAKFSGRWRNGAPLTTFATEDEAKKFMCELGQARVKAQDTKAPADIDAYQALKKKLTAFNYDKDIDGSRCPVGAHMRRTNPRGALEFGVKKAYATPGALVNRRRILRRGLPYGEVKDASRDDGNHGIVFMALNADIERQFEFVQQQWIVYGNDFKLSNDKDPLLGNHKLDADGQPDGRMVFEGDKKTGKPPYFCSRIPRLVEVRGGDYFFIPSLTALRMISDGIIDPT